MRISVLGKELVIKDEYVNSIHSESFKMKNETSYLEKFSYKILNDKKYKNGALQLKLNCLNNLKSKLKPYNSYFDCLAGLGISCKIFEAKNNLLNDFDDDCVKVLKDNFNQESVIQEDIFKFKFKNKFDLIFADFNNFTFKRFKQTYEPVLKTIFENSNKYVIINDCSVFYLRYGKTSFDVYNKNYGFNISELEDYFHEIKKYYKANYGWNLINVERFSESSFLLFSKEDGELLINKNTKETSSEILTLL